MHFITTLTSYIIHTGVIFKHLQYILSCLVDFSGIFLLGETLLSNDLSDEAS